MIAQYTYDEWGKLLEIHTEEEDDEEQLSIAEINPLRYRGYYYDNETGYYYLKSRYYHPELCRFISADSFEYINTSNFFSTNAYTYCWNSPIAFDDEEGNTPKLSVNTASLIDFLSNVNIKISESLQKNFEKLQGKFNAFAEKAKFYLQNPDIFINKTLSKLLGHEVNLKFRILYWIKENVSVSDNSNENNESAIAPINLLFDFAENEKTDNWLVAVLKGLGLALEINAFTEIFEAILKIVNPFFNFNDWYNSSSLSTQNYFDEIIMSGVTVMNTLYSYFTEEIFDKLAESLENWSIGEINEEILGKELNSLLDLFNVFKSINENDNYNTIEYTVISDFIDIGCFLLCFVHPSFAIGADLINDLIKSTMSNY